MSALAKPRVSPEEYLALEREAEYKSQYFNGEVLAMAGGSYYHNIITGNIIRELGNLFKKHPCGVCPSDMKIKVPKTVLFTYADAVVVCGNPKFDDKMKDVLLNPTLIVEVLSESTEAYDRGKKFEQYRQLPSFREYLLVAQDRCRIEQFSKQEDARWLFSEIHDMAGAVKLSSVDGELAAAEVYDKVEFES